MSDTGLPEVPAPGAPKEPLLPVAAISAFVVSAIALGVAYGLNISDDQQAAILGFIAPAAVIVTVIWSRLRVFAPRTVRQLVHQAVAQERLKRAAKTTADADVRDVKPGWLPPDLTS